MKPRAMIVTVLPMVAILVIVVSLARHPWSASRVAGLVLMIFGFGFLTAARINLGSSFSVTPQATALVTNGVYSRIRNPIYVFSAVGATGLFLYVEKTKLLLLIPPIVVIQILRARAESRLLEERFGDDYRRYRARTWF